MMRIARTAFPLFALLALLGMLMASCNRETAGDLEAGWRNPPADARPHAYWLWLNGYVDPQTARDELDAMKEAGFSGVLLFDMGARGDASAQPPAGPAFLSEPWMAQMKDAVAHAKKLGIQVDFSVASSWDMGGHWIEPEHASKGIYISETTVQGGAPVDVTLPFPEPPQGAPLGPEGKPAYWVDTAVVAIPDAKRAAGHDIVLQLDPPAEHVISAVVLDQGDPGALPIVAALSPVKEFSVSVSTTGTNDGDFREVLRAVLPQGAGARRFALPDGTRARYTRLRLVSSYHADRKHWTLGEFEVLDASGANLAGSHAADRTKSGAELMRGSPGISATRTWSVHNIHNGEVNGARGMYATGGLPPFQIPDAAQVVNVTSKVDREGRLRWNDAPAGNWTILRYVVMNTGERLKVPSPNSDGWATDHLSAPAADAHMEYVIARLRETFGNLQSSGLRNLYLASYEVVGPVWSPGFLADFQRLRGYDMTPYLPVVFGAQVRDEATTERFLFDYRKTLSDVLITAYYRAAGAASNKAGLGIKSEAGGPGPPIHNVPVDALLANSAVDEIQGEFWPFRPTADNLWVVKETASAGHLYGKPRVHMEAFTSTDHWREGPQDLKPSADRVFIEGGNHMVWHTWSHAPPDSGKPGWVYGAGSHVNRNVTWWPKIKPFVSYLSRSSYMLQRGQFVGDVLYYYGDGGYKFVLPRKVKPELGPGYDYDYINSDGILNRLQVKDGRFVYPDGNSYAVLVMPDSEAADPAVLAKIDALVKAGGTMIGARPQRAEGLSNYPASDERVRGLASQMWAELSGQGVTSRAHGTGKVVWGQTPREVLTAMGIGPDVTAPETIDFIHRRDGNAEIYFLRNLTDEPVAATVMFRVDDKAPELWDPVTGEIGPAFGARQAAKGQLAVPVELAGNGSIFVVFRRNGTTFAPMPEALTGLPAPIEISSNWTVDFENGPSSVAFPELRSWSEREEAAIRSFAGNGRYRSTFQVPSGWRNHTTKAEIDLGKLSAIGEVWLNGKPLGITWTQPFRLDATEALRDGENELVVEVTNTWHNRLVADAKLPVAERSTRTNVTVTMGKPFAQSELLPSGLLGPVRLVATAR
ncbi:MAG: hypothetical protein KIT83_01765 [Bryobacterales bacterium]|nr:hypothetical protein [Bryobacterales bacterium]